MVNRNNFDWSDLAFGSKKAIKDLGAIFIAAPIKISDKRFLQLVKEYLPKSNLVIGIAKENFIDGFEGQPHFSTFKINDKIVEKINKQTHKHKIYTLNYYQRELKYILEKIKFSKALFINGSWEHAFHLSEIFYTLVNKGIDYELIPRFTSDDEAKQYARAIMPKMLSLVETKNLGLLREDQVMNLAIKVSRLSFDYNNQVGAVLAKKIANSNKYKILSFAYNKIVPYETYAMQHGSLREKNFSPPNDLNFYDTVHAEIELLIKANKNRIDLDKATLFTSVMPCPPCARAISLTEINEIIYKEDHSDGYAIDLLSISNKKIRRVMAKN